MGKGYYTQFGGNPGTVVQGISSQIVLSNLALGEGKTEIPDNLWLLVSKKCEHILINMLI